MRVRVTKYCKLHAYMRGRGADRGAKPFVSAYQIDRENPFSVNTDWGIMIRHSQISKKGFATFPDKKHSKTTKSDIT